MIKVFTDGGARGNPGPAACAFVVFDEEKIIHKESKYLGEGTNNVAEYSGVLLALSWLKENLRGVPVNFFLDSELVVKQLNGIYKIRNKILLDLVIQIKEIEKELGVKINYKNVPREKNKLADKLVNNELDSRRGR